MLVSAFMISADVNKEWKLYKNFNGVKVFTKVESNTLNGIKRNYLVFKYENTNKTTVELSWKLNVWYNGTCRACNLPSPNEYEMFIRLKPGEIKSGNASSASKKFSVFYSSDDENIAPLDKFEFANARVITIK